MKFRAYINKLLDGPYPVSELCQLPGFSRETLVCPDGENEWMSADQYSAITDFMRQTSSGDYKPEPLTPQELLKVPTNDWRHAVIGRDIPRRKSYTAPWAETSTGFNRGHGRSRSRHSGLQPLSDFLGG